MLGDEDSRARAAALTEELAAADVAAVALGYVDNSGISRTKGVPIAKLADAAVWGVGMSPVFDAFVLDDSITTSPSAGGPMGDLRLVPDLDRLTVLAAEPGWAWAPVDRWSQSGEHHPQCQRTFVRRMTDRAAALGIRAEMAFEVEWMLSQGLGDDFVPATEGPAYGSTRLVDLSAYGIDLLRALADQQVEVCQFHPEYAPSQFELSVACTDPLRAADKDVLVRRTIQAVSRRHGLRPSFAPAVIAGGVGNGHHLHLSLWRDDQDLFAGGKGPYRLATEAEAFLAAMLASLPALLAVGAPSVASYLRLVPQHWAGDFRCWGHENREAAVRLVTASPRAGGWTANAELKPIDATASPYLVVGAVLAAGLAGIGRGDRLPPEVTVDPGELSDADRTARGIDRLPTSLDETTSRLAGDEVLAEALGIELHETLLAVRRAESALFAGASDEEVIARSRWRH